MWHLTKRVSWGSVFDIPDVAVLGRFKCAIGVGGNITDVPPSVWPSWLPERLPYFKIAQPDSEPIDGKLYGLLVDTLWSISRLDLTPVFIHCRAGQMRSPAVAIMTAKLLGDGSWEGLVERAKQLRPDILYDARTGDIMPYCQSLLRLAGCPESLIPPKKP